MSPESPQSDIEASGSGNVTHPPEIIAAINRAAAAREKGRPEYAAALLACVLLRQAQTQNNAPNTPAYSGLETTQ